MNEVTRLKPVVVTIQSIFNKNVLCVGEAVPHSLIDNKVDASGVLSDDAGNPLGKIHLKGVPVHRFKVRDVGGRPTQKGRHISMLLATAYYFCKSRPRVGQLTAAKELAANKLGVGFDSLKTPLRKLKNEYKVDLKNGDGIAWMHSDQAMYSQGAAMLFTSPKWSRSGLAVSISGDGFYWDALLGNKPALEFTGGAEFSEVDHDFDVDGTINRGGALLLVVIGKSQGR